MNGFKTGAGVLCLTSFLLYGCATPENARQEVLFNKALTEHTTRHFVSAQPFASLSRQVFAALSSLGYSQIVYENAPAAFAVLNKNTSGSFILSETEAPQLMVKFTQWQGEQTRVDFSNGSFGLKTKMETQRDLAILLKQLEAKALIS